MSATTGPILAAGGLVVGNAVIVHERQPVTQTRVVVGTLIAAAGFNLLERVSPRPAVALAWLVLVATVFVRAEPNTPSPVESIMAWLNTK